MNFHREVSLTLFYFFLGFPVEYLDLSCRKLILYGYVYDVDYSYLRNYNTELGRISSSLNQIAKRVNSTGNIYPEDIDEVKELMNEVYLPAFDTIPIALVCSIHLIGIITNLFNPASLLTASNCTRLKSGL